MRRPIVALAAAALATVAAAGAFGQARNGPIVDRIIYDVRMDQTIGIKDTVEGKTDVFMQGLDGKTFKSIGDADRAKLDVYGAPSGSTSLQLNPYPNKAPYTFAAKDGKSVFNPLAIRELRYALNWLVDRQKIADEILLGVGDPTMTPMTPGQPGTYKFNLVAAKLGITARGNEKRALTDIDNAMKAAAKLPENAGKLEKSGQWWTWNGEPVVVKIMMRVDDPTNKLLVGRYLGDQIEKAGIKAERLEWDRTKCLDTLRKTDPADFQWSIYTEGWTSGATRTWWDGTLSQMYAPYANNMPGVNTKGFWQYENPEIDRLAKRNENGWFQDEADYWEGGQKAVELGLKEAVRIYLTSQTQLYIANKGRMKSRMFYGLGDGLTNRFSLRTADVPPNEKGEKVLRVTMYSARGGLFMSAWDPVGTQGFTDTYSTNIVRYCYDPSTFESPNAAKDTPLRVSWDLAKVETKVKPDASGEGLVGLIPVDKRAVIYNSRSRKWESGIEYKELGKGKYDYVKSEAISSYSKNVATYLPGKWHSGAPIGIEDLMYATAFQYEWSNKDGDGDKLYDKALASRYQADLLTAKGQVVDGMTFTGFYDYNWPMDKARVAQYYVPGPKAGAPGRPVGVSWEITEAIAKLVVEGSKGGAVYTIAADASMTPIDVIGAKCVADIRAKLQDMADAKYVPASIAPWISPDQAVARYKAALAFIDKYGHALISNGPFFISKVDTNANYIELSAFRDYPYKADYWPNAFRTTLTRIDQVDFQPMAQKGKDFSVDVTVFTVTYPDDLAKAADEKAKVTLTLISSDGTEKNFAGKFAKPGSFRVTVPAADLASLKSGNYNFVVQSVLASEAPSIVPSTMMLF